MAIPALLAGLGGRAAAGGMGARMGQFAGMNAAGNLLSGGGGGTDPFTSMDRQISSDPPAYNSDDSNPFPYSM